MNSNVIDINKSNYYKRKATILVSGLITVIALLISFLLYSDYSILSINDKISQQNIDIINLRRILVDLDIQIKEFEDSKKLWSQINSKNQIRNGLDFDAVRNLIVGLNKLKWLFSPIVVNISPPSFSLLDKSVNLGPTKIGVELSKVDIRIIAPSDIIIMKIVKYIVDNFPGYVSFESFKMSREKSVTLDMLNNLKTGIIPDLVECQMVISWRNLKDVGN